MDKMRDVSLWFWEGKVWFSVRGMVGVQRETLRGWAILDLCIIDDLILLKTEKSSK